MNAIALTGNVVADAELVQLGEGRTLANFRMGNNELVNGESRVNGFFDVTVFGDAAKRAAELTKGERVIVVGRLQHNSYQREDGSTGYRTKLIANEVGLSTLFETAVRPKTTQNEAQGEGPF